MADFVMWEVRAAPGRLTQLLAWVTATVGPSAQIFTSIDAGDGDDARIVVIAADIAVLADPPAGLLARPAHSWPFRRVREG